MYKVPAPKLQPVDNNPYKKLLFNPYLFSKKLDLLQLAYASEKKTPFAFSLSLLYHIIEQKMWKKFFITENSFSSYYFF